MFFWWRYNIARNFRLPTTLFWVKSRPFDGSSFITSNRNARNDDQGYEWYERFHKMLRQGVGGCAQWLWSEEEKLYQDNSTLTAPSGARDESRDSTWKNTHFDLSCCSVRNICCLPWLWITLSRGCWAISREGLILPSKGSSGHPFTTKVGWDE